MPTLMNESVSVIDVNGRTIMASWSDILNNPQNYAAIPTCDPFLLPPLVLFAAAVHYGATKHNCSINKYIQQYRLDQISDQQGLLGRLGFPITWKKKNPLTSYKAPYEIDHTSSTVPNFFHHQDHTRFDPATRHLITSLLLHNINPINNQRSPLLDGICIPVGQNSLKETIDRINGRINGRINDPNSKPIWEYNAVDDYIQSCQSYVKGKNADAWELMFLPVLDYNGGCVITIPSKQFSIKGVKLFADSSNPPYAYVHIASPGQGSITVAYSYAVIGGDNFKRPSRLKIPDPSKSLDDLQGKQANEKYKNKLQKVISTLKLDEILKDAESELNNLACAAFMGRIVEALEDSQILGWARGREWMRIFRDLEIDQRFQKLAKEILICATRHNLGPGEISLNNLKQFRLPQPSQNILSPQTGEREKYLGMVGKGTGTIDPKLHFVMQRTWRSARLVLMDLDVAKLTKNDNL